MNAGSLKWIMSKKILKMGMTRTLAELQKRGSFTSYFFLPFHQMIVAPRATSGVHFSNVYCTRVRLITLNLYSATSSTRRSLMPPPLSFLCTARASVTSLTTVSVM